MLNMAISVWIELEKIIVPLEKIDQTELMLAAHNFYDDTAKLCVIKSLNQKI